VGMDGDDHAARSHHHRSRRSRHRCGAGKVGSAGARPDTV
jgi:hypothetical protein